MSHNERRYGKAEFAQRGDALYEQIKPLIESENLGKFVLIDIVTGAYEVDASELAAGDRLSARLPDAQPWMRRVGLPYARRFGGRPIRVGQ